MVPALYQAAFPGLNPFWQAFAPQPPAEPTSQRASAVTPRAAEPIAAPHEAAMAMLNFWLGASETATKFWSGPTSPMAMAPRMALKAQEVVAEAMAPKPQSTSWYRAPMGTQDVASGALGFMAGPFAALLPAFTAAPFWSPMAAMPAQPPFSASPMPFPAMQSMWAEQPWARMWMNALAGAASAQPATPVAMLAAFVPPAPVMPSYQSDSGHAVAQIVHTTARVMMAILPLVALLVAVMTTLSGQQPMLIA